MAGGNNSDGGGATERGLTREQAVRLAEAYVGAYNGRDLEAMLALLDENVVSYPARLFGQRQTNGHAGVRDWWQTMVDSGRWYEVAIRETRALAPDRVAILGDLLDHGERVSPWGVVARVHDGLIVESRSYLSDDELLDALGVLE